MKIASFSTRIPPQLLAIPIDKYHEREIWKTKLERGTFFAFHLNG